MKTLSENLVLCPPSNMVFHWSDSFEACEAIKSLVSRDISLSLDFKSCEKALNQLRLVPVWIKTEKRVYQTTMYDLYEEYILRKENLYGSLDPFCPYQISFMSGTGPYRRMSITECLNETTYREFFLIFLLKGRLSVKDFRLRLKSKILMEYGTDYTKAELVGLEQLTSEGMIISINSDFYTKEYSSIQSMRLLLNSQVLSCVEDKNLDEISSHLSQYEFNLLYSSSKNDSVTFNLSDLVIQSTFDFSNDKKMTLFVSYEKISESNSVMAAHLKEFIFHVKKLVLIRYMQDAELKKMA